MRFMAERKYSVQEINELREWVSDRCAMPYAQFSNPTSVEASNYQAARTKMIEEQLRTYMMNGTTVEELRGARGPKADNPEDAK